MYDVEYFIKKFEAIPEDEWCEGDFVKPYETRRRCALGHCGMDYDKELPEEAKALVNLVFELYGPSIVSINDGLDYPFNKLEHPKLRVLKALYDLKNRDEIYE